MPRKAKTKDAAVSRLPIEKQKALYEAAARGDNAEFERIRTGGAK